MVTNRRRKGCASGADLYTAQYNLGLPWVRTGGKGAFIQLKGMEGFTGMYVGEIPAGGAPNRERHLYEELIYSWRATA